jgi:hypothetical protein
MNAKQQQTAEFLEKPIKVGDWVTITVTPYGKKTKKYVQVKSVDDAKVYYDEYGYSDAQSCLLENVVRCVRHIGENPFKPELRSTSYQIDIEQLFWRGGFDRREKQLRNQEYFDVDLEEVCLNPMVIGENGEEIEYQRGLVWSLL